MPGREIPVYPDIDPIIVAPKKPLEVPNSPFAPKREPDPLELPGEPDWDQEPEKVPVGVPEEKPERILVPFRGRMSV